MPFKDIADFYRTISPRSTSGNTSTEKQDIQQILKKLILNPSGRFYSFDEIKKEIEEHYKKESNDTTSSKKSLNLHALGATQLNLADDTYWGNSCKSIAALLPKNDPQSAANEDTTKASIFAIRNPFISPSSRGTEEIDFFLNYTPPIVAAQMFPYLEVEFHIKRDSSSANSNTPSVMRFLLGSGKNKDKNPTDKFLATAGNYNLAGAKKEGDRKTSVSGMELFLMPQTLTNMDSLSPQGSGSESARLVRVKPFLPFASLEGFDVSMANAGAGSFVHKKGSLKLKIHDKARLSEFSEIFKSADGFSQVTIWTIYGWIAPRGREDEDPYSSFINKNMLVKDCWQIMNTQFSFDQSGQVSVSLEVVSSAAKGTYDLTVCEADEVLKKFHETIKRIDELRRSAAPSGEKFNVSAIGEQVLNAASTNGIFTPDLRKKLAEALASIKASLSDSGIGQAAADEAIGLIESLGKTHGENSYESYLNNSESLVKKKFDNLVRSDDKPDPFLLVESKKDYYPQKSANVIAEIQTFIEHNENRNRVLAAAAVMPLTPKRKNKAQEPAQGLTRPIVLKADVVSFGKLFTNFVLPSLIETKLHSEVQIFFYGLNDSCGPMAGLSIAEFPIDLSLLVYAYNDAIKRLKVNALSLKAFLSLVVDDQFVNKGAIAYGMNRNYKITEENGSVKSSLNLDDGATRDAHAAWLSKYGQLKLPVIEMFIEAGEIGPISGNDPLSILRGSENSKEKGGKNNTILRIHIYDKANNPYSLIQKVINTGTNLEVGDIDDGELDRLISSCTPNQLDQLKKLGNEDNKSKNFKQSLTAAGLDKFNLVKQPGGVTVIIPSDRQSFKDRLLASVPSIVIGTNGSLVLSVAVASKTDGLMGTINLTNIAKGNSPGTAGVSGNGLMESNGLPMTVLPVQLTMTTLGIPTAQLYQTYFVDFDTGTTLDNLYSCMQLQHSMTQGKFNTSWTLTYTDGYGKFGAAPSVNAIISGKAANKLKALAEVEK